MASLLRLDSILRRLQREPSWQRSQQFLTILEHWTTVCGSQVALHTQPQRLKDGVLLVATSTAVWAQELTLQRVSLRHKLLALQPSLALKEVRFSTQGWQDLRLPPPTPAQSAPTTTVNLSSNLLVSEDPAERLAQVIQRRRQSTPRCSRCQGSAHPASLKRWGYCLGCRCQELRV